MDAFESILFFLGIAGVLGLTLFLLGIALALVTIDDYER